MHFCMLTIRVRRFILGPYSLDIACKLEYAVTWQSRWVTGPVIHVSGPEPSGPSIVVGWVGPAFS